MHMISSTVCSRSARSLLLLSSCAGLLAACSSPASPPAENTSIAGRTGSTAITSQAIGAGYNSLTSEPWEQTPINGYGPPEINRSNGSAGASDGATLTLNGTTYSNGIGVHANSELIYNIAAQCRTFTAQIGVDDEVGSNGSVVFQVFVDNMKRYDSGVMTGATATKSVSVDIEGAERLKLVVTNGGDNIDYDHADWITPRINTCIVYQGPTVITTGGTYTGNWKSTDPSVPAVRIATTAPVTIQNSVIASRGQGIAWAGGTFSKYSTGSTNTTIVNNRLYGLNPDIDAVAKGRAIDLQYSQSTVIEHNTLIGTAGIYVNEFWGAAPNAMTVRYNKAINIDGRVSSGTGTYRTTLNRYSPTVGSDGSGPDGGAAWVQFMQLNNSKDRPNVEIAWNRVVNEPRNSRVEDNINISGSSGTASAPIRIHHNLIYGAYGTDPAHPYSGGGILLGDGCTASDYQSAYNNTVLETSNYGMAVANGNNKSIADNTIYGVGKLPDGTFTDVGNKDTGIYLRDYCNSSAHVASTVVAQRNTVGWGKPSSTNATARGDFSNSAGTLGTGSNANTQVNGGVGAIPQSLIDNAVTAWDNAAAAAGLTIGAP